MTTDTPYRKRLSMVYKIYISTQDNNKAYEAATQRALFSINEMGVSALGAHDIPILGKQRHATARHMIQQSDVFLGIYDSAYGDVPEGETKNHLEIEYDTAIEQNIARLIFVMDDAVKNANERQQEFLRYVMENNVVTFFSDADDLSAKVKVAIDNYHQTQPHRRKLLPPQSNFRDRLPDLPINSAQSQDASEDDFDEKFARALNLAGDDLQQIMRRALELHDAQKQVNEPTVDSDFDNKITVEPLWGEPIRRSQFQSDIFMVMPFRDKYNAIYEDVIRPVAANLNLTIKRGDEFTSTRGSIMQEVWAALNACKLVIVETTEVNANVYYELGIAHTLGKPAILITQTKDVVDLPFDIRHLRFTVYDDTIEGSKKLEESLRQSIIWLMNDLDEQDM